MITELQTRVAELMSQGMRRRDAYSRAHAEAVAALDAAWRATLPSDER